MKTLKLLGLGALLAVAACIAIAGSARIAAAQSPMIAKDIYPDASQAKADLAHALKTAAATHKRIIIDFGGNWCGDCKVLDIYSNDATNRPLLEANFVVVHINIGHMDANVDIAEKYDVPLKKGVPALAVLSDKGELLYSQKTGEFENMRRMQSSDLTAFLMQWKPSKKG